MTDASLRLFEQPAHQDQAVLSCGHRADMPAIHPKRRDGWWRAVRCTECQLTREVVSVIYVKAPNQEV